MPWIFKCLMQHSDIPSKQNKLPDKTGKINVVSDLAISTQEVKKF